jgi:hypothetical protein
MEKWRTAITQTGGRTLFVLVVVLVLVLENFDEPLVSRSRTRTILRQSNHGFRFSRTSKSFGHRLPVTNKRSPAES